MRNACAVFLVIVALVVAVMTSAQVRAADPVKPAQLVGSWVRSGPADMSGLEFTKAGKALIYFGNANQAESDDYSILDDGRLNLSEGGAVNNFFLPTLSGDKLQLKSADSGKVAEYRRLKSGETMAAAIANQVKADQQALQSRNAALPNFLSRPDLVMIVQNPPANAPAPCAIQWAPTSKVDYSGRANFDSKPPHVEMIGAQIQGTEDSPIVAVWFGPGTAQQNGGRGTWSFHITGQGNEMALTSQINFGEAFSTGPNNTVIIKSDPTMYKQINDAIKAETARLDALKAPVAAMLKDYMVIKGMSQSALPADKGGFVEDFVLSRNPQQANTWVGQGQSVNRGSGATEIFPVVATMGILNGKPAIQIQSQKKLYQFTEIDTTGGKLSGLWHQPNNPNGFHSEMQIVQALDAKGRDQLFATRKTALTQMAGGAVFHAVINDQYTNNSQPPNPITVTLNVSNPAAITGTVVYPLEGCTMNLKGKETDTPLGPQLVLQYSGGQANPGAWADVAAFINLVQHEMWTLSLSEDSSGTMRLTGYAVTNPTPTAQPITLQLLPYTDKDKAAVTAALANSHFKVIYPKMDGPDDIVDITVDAGNKVNGVVSAGGHRLNTAVGTKFSGDIKDLGGWVELDTLYVPRPGAKPNYGYMLIATPTDAGLYINGEIYGTNAGPTRPLGRWDAVQVKQ